MSGGPTPIYSTQSAGLTVLERLNQAPFSHFHTAQETALVSIFPRSENGVSCANIEVGQGLAMLEMSLTIATLFRWYDLTFNDGFEMEFQPSFTMCAKNGLMLRITEKN